MLTTKSVNCLHQVAALLSPGEFEQAVQILMSHHPDVRQERLRRRAEQLALYQAMPGAERLAYEKTRIAEAHARKEKAYFSQVAIKDQIRGEISIRLADVFAMNYRPMFFHYYEYMGCYGVDKKTGIEYRIKTLKATSCLLIDKATTEAHSKGIAIVSDLDNPSKLAGRNLSLDRALTGLEDKATCDPISRWEAKYIAKAIDKEAAYMGNWTNKVVYNPDLGQLTQLEIERLDQWRSKRKETLIA
jgi:hypothetical protein